MYEPRLMVISPKGDPDPTESQFWLQAFFTNFLSKQIYRNAGGVKRR